MSKGSVHWSGHSTPHKQLPSCGQAGRRLSAQSHHRYLQPTSWQQQDWEVARTHTQGICSSAAGSCQPAQTTVLPGVGTGGGWPFLRCVQLPMGNSQPMSRHAQSLLTCVAIAHLEVQADTSTGVQCMEACMAASSPASWLIGLGNHNMAAMCVLSSADILTHVQLVGCGFAVLMGLGQFPLSS